MKQHLVDKNVRIELVENEKCLEIKVIRVDSPPLEVYLEPASLAKAITASEHGFYTTNLSIRRLKMS